MNVYVSWSSFGEIRKTIYVACNDELFVLYLLVTWWQTTQYIGFIPEGYNRKHTGLSGD